ncbi:tyrosine-protein phosphatase [Rhodococcus sp. NPDC057014]|uniref:tyrosine-protein phosphatase n=1 Tax=Rhodococcus sp. NPDC057014 TaxID=3346000 RepID=UPI00363EC2F5
MRTTNKTTAVCVSIAALTITFAGCSRDTPDSTLSALPPSVTVSQLVDVTAPTKAPILISANNFRDLAGPDIGYITSDGRRVREGVVYRSNALTTNDSDAAALDSLGIKTVFDLRTPAEVTEKPDRVPAGARYQNIDVSGGTKTATVLSSVDLSTPEGARNMVTGAYRKIVTDPAMRAQFGALLTDVAVTDGPLIIHCSAGKDRAGWASAVLLKIAGVDDATVMSNYLLTNEYSKDSIESVVAKTTASDGEQAGAAVRVIYGVSPEFLQAGFDEISTIFGTFENYLTMGLGLTPDSIAALKTKLTS